MNLRSAVSMLLIPFCISTNVSAKSASDVVCSIAPSQSKLAAGIGGAAGSASATLSGVAAATGLSVVTHSSGALILTGTSGYIAGTIGAAAVAPVVVGVGLLVGGTLVIVEVVCVKENHPKLVQQVEQSALEYSKRFNAAMKETTIAVGKMTKKVSPAAGDAAVRAKQIATDVWQYVNRASIDLIGNLPGGKAGA